MGKTKKDTNARVAGRRKQTKESAAGQMRMDNIPMDLNASDDSSVKSHCKHRCYRCEVPNFYRTFLFSLNR